MGKILGGMAGALMLAAWAGTSHGATIVYTDLTQNVVAAYAEPTAGAPAFGDALHLTQAGILHNIGLTLYNGDANGGVILAGSMQVLFFDNTSPYGGGSILQPFLGSAFIPFDYSAFGGLPAGGYDAELFDVSALGIHLPQDVLVIQQFTQTAGDSQVNGAVIVPNPTVGTSPNTVFISSAFTPQGLYAFSGVPAQFGYQIEVDPAVTTAPTPLPAGVWGGMALMGLLGAWNLQRRRA